MGNCRGKWHLGGAHMYVLNTYNLSFKYLQVSVSEVKNRFILRSAWYHATYGSSLKSIEVVAKGRSHHFLTLSCIPGTDLGSFHLVLLIPLYDGLYFPCFTADTAKAQRSKVIHLRSHSWSVMETDFESQQFACKTYAVIHQAVILCELEGKWINVIVPQKTTEKISNINL